MYLEIKNSIGKNIVTFLLCMILIIFMSPNVDAKSPESEVEFLIKYDESVRTLSNVDLLEDVMSREKITENVERIIFSTTEDIADLQKKLEMDDAIAVVEPNVERQLFSKPNDPYYSLQWWVPHIQTEASWSFSTQQKKDIVVAVIDSGIDSNHEDLRGKIAAGGYNFYHNNTNTTDYDGHGTNIAGVIAANSNNNIGITGVTGSFNIKILPIKISHTDGKSTVSDLIRAMDYAISQNVDVINLSLGGAGSSRLENEAMQRAIQAGIPVVAAAGNDALLGNPINYPASYNNVLSISAVDRYNNRARFSSYNKYVDLTAPGEDIYTIAPYNQYTQVNGTSYSAPIVAGTVAMMKAVQPDLTVSNITNILQQTATDIGPPGKDIYFGSGLVNIEESLKNVASDDLVKVQGVELNTNAIHLNLDTEKRTASSIQPINHEDLLQHRSRSSIEFEREPNNDYWQANSFSPGNSIVGSITNRSYDLDYFKFTLDTDGRFSLLGSWIESYFVSQQDNHYLTIGLFDQQDNLIQFARLTDNDYQFLSRDLEKGIYYLVVFQASPYEYLFVNEEYMLTTLFTPNKAPEPEQQPEMLFERIFMEAGESEQFIDYLPKGTVVQSTVPTVATVDENGTVHAIGHGETTIHVTIHDVRYEAIVKVTKQTTEATSALFETVLPVDATNKKVRWSSSNPNIAIVDEHGIITAKGAGETFITVTTEEGNYTSRAKITVEDSSEFEGDFPKMTVAPNKVFTITFNKPLIEGHDYSNVVKIMHDFNEQELFIKFTAIVNPANPNQLLVSPNTVWDKGIHYFSLSKELPNADGQTLNKEVKMQFDVR